MMSVVDVVEVDWVSCEGCKMGRMCTGKSERRVKSIDEDGGASGDAVAETVEDLVARRFFEIPKGEI